MLGGSAARAATPEETVAFQSCGDLLGYAKAQANRLVGPWGLGEPVSGVGRKRRPRL